jgi:dehydrogenase/reductase SDR family protein 4
MKILEGKVAVITGASRGLGKAIAEAYAAAGAKVILSARSKEAIEKNASVLKSQGFDASAFVCDVTDPQQVEALARFALQTCGRSADEHIRDVLRFHHRHAPFPVP